MFICFTQNNRANVYVTWQPLSVHWFVVSSYVLQPDVTIAILKFASWGSNDGDVAFTAARFLLRLFWDSSTTKVKAQTTTKFKYNNKEQSILRCSSVFGAKDKGADRMDSFPIILNFQVFFCKV